MSRLNSTALSWALCLSLVLCLGCEISAPSSNPPTLPTPAEVPAATLDPRDQPDPRDQVVADDEPPPPAKPIELRDMNWEQLQSLVAEQKGKVVVVDIWSTACEPCLREFPHLVALQQRHPGNVVCISFDTDYIGVKKKPVEYYRERVLKVLNENKAEGLINAMSTVAADELFQQIDVDSIPAVYVFDREGKLSKRFDNRTPAGGDEEGISYQKQIDPLVAELVKADQS